MHHVNPNMIAFVQQGIAAAERGDRAEFNVHFATVNAAKPVPFGDRPFVVSGFLSAKALARAEGFIAAYDMCDCGGRTYATGSVCRETGTPEVMCTDCDFRDY